ncbi:MAG: cupin domain-containing protein [Eggerthellaceae bacterium]|nr:cupin domain-containing protein [Eggerthellaceae bacterium]
MKGRNVKEIIKNVAHGENFKLAELVDLEPGKVNSVTLAQEEGAKVTVFAIDEGEGMSSHAAPGDALVTVLEGTGQITIEDVPHRLSTGESIVMSAGAPHSVLGVTPFKMLLVVVKES